MTLWFYIFIASLAGLIILPSVRMFEEKRGLPRFLLSMRRIVNVGLRKGMRLISFDFSSHARRGGTHVIHKAREIRENPTLRRGVKRGITIIARVSHDIIVSILRFLGKIRKRIVTLHDRHID